jgi:hypothetical protein
MSLTASREEPPVPDWSGVLFFQQRESAPSLACLDRQNPGRASKSPNPSGWRQTNPAMILSGFFSQNTRKYLHMHVFLQEACRSSWTRRQNAPLGLTAQREGLPLPRTSSTTCRVSSFWSSGLLRDVNLDKPAGFAVFVSDRCQQMIDICCIQGSVQVGLHRWVELGFGQEPVALKVHPAHMQPNLVGHRHGRRQAEQPQACRWPANAVGCFAHFGA